MKTYPALMVFLITLAISFAPQFAPFYSKLFIGGKLLEFTSLNTYAVNSEKPDESQFIIPVDQYQGLLPSEIVVSLGIIRPATTVHCFNKVSSQNKRTLPLFDMPNTPIDIDLAVYPECAGTMEITVPHSSEVRIQHSGVVAIGSRNLISASSRIVVLFCDRLRLLLTFLIIFCLFIETSNSRLGVSINGSNDFNPNLKAWSIFLAYSSGLLTTLLPVEIPAETHLKLLYVMSAFCHLSPVLSYLNGNRRFGKALTVFFAATVLGLVLLPKTGISYAYCGLGLALIAILKAIYKRDCSLYLFLFNVSLFITYIKILLPPGTVNILLPHWLFASVFIAGVLVFRGINTIRHSSKIHRALRFIHQRLAENTLTDDIQSSLAAFSEIVNCKKVSLLKINHDNSCTIFTYLTKSTSCFGEFNQKTLSTLPPVFAHVITTSSPLVHVDEQSDFSKRVQNKSGVGPLNLGKFSVFPLITSEGVSGAISCTGYNIEESDIEEVNSFETTLKIFSGFFSRLVTSISRENELQLGKVLDEAVHNINKLSSLDDQYRMGQIVSNLGQLLGCRGFVGIIESKIINITTLFGYDGEARSKLESIEFLVDSENDHGPIPLAIRTRKPTFVNDLALIKSFLTPDSVAFLESCNAQSLAAIPVFVESQSNLSDGIPWAVIYLDSETQRFFTDHVQRLVIEFVSALNQRLSYLSTLQKKNLVDLKLREFVPEEVRSRLLSGGVTRVNQFGFLICIDLVGSTELSKKHGTAVLKRLVDSGQKFLVGDQAGLHRGQLLLVIWDAFFVGCENLNWDLKLWALNLRTVLRTEGMKAGLESANKLDLRVVVTYGDISRDFENSGSVRTWTIVGNAMAVVCKLENSLKGEPPGIYCDQAAMAKLTPDLLVTPISNGLVRIGLMSENTDHVAA